jgi:hypothetical protein
MTIKIKAPFVWVNPLFTIYQSKDTRGQQNYRLVRESDWRKLMRLVKAVQIYDQTNRDYADVMDALNALEKKK